MFIQDSSPWFVYIVLQQIIKAYFISLQLSLSQHQLQSLELQALLQHHNTTPLGCLDILITSDRNKIRDITDYSTFDQDALYHWKIIRKISLISQEFKIQLSFKKLSNVQISMFITTSRMTKKWSSHFLRHHVTQ